MRPITVRDLLTFRMGFGSVMAPSDSYPIQKLIREYRIGGDGPPRPSQAPTAEEWLRRLGSLPWMAQPGERWLYHVSSDVLGILIARVSGQSLGTFLRERIFDPLGMKDTGFYVPPDKIDRFPGATHSIIRPTHSSCMTIRPRAHGDQHRHPNPLAAVWYQRWTIISGRTGTTAYVDPAEDMIGILFTQRMMDSPEPPKVFSDFWTLAYGALV